ncbi:MAG TPA: hypothetical protein VME20_14295 [Acidimicrobiales bacterium]|nr:hypothetical protein [Acidimicrobiales bacterium]
MPLTTVIATTPGTMKSMYFTGPVRNIWPKLPPNTYTNINMRATGIATTVIIVSGLRTMWLKLRLVIVQVSLNRRITPLLFDH